MYCGVAARNYSLCVYSSSSSSSCSSSSSSSFSLSSSLSLPPRPPSKQSSRLLLRLRDRPTPLTAATLRRTLLRFSKPTLLSTLRHLLLLQEWQIALPMYLALVNAPWFKWDPGLLAELTALLDKCHETRHSQVLLETHHEKLNSKQLLEFKCALILHYARYHLKTEMLATFKSMEMSSDSHARISAFSSLIQAYACMDLPHDAYATVIDMQTHGFKPSSKDLKAVLFSFGRCGLFDNMERITSDMEKLGFLKDPVVFNMIINTYATVENHSKIKEWIDKMLASGVKPTVRSLNAVAKACPVLTKLSTRNTYVPIALLFEYLETNCATQGEIKSVEYLVKLCLVQEAVKWDTSWQLDLHSTVVGSAYVMLLCWLKEVLGRLDTQLEFPSEIVIVTGWGKHSETRGSSLIKLMVRDLLENMGSPFMVDSQNKGRLFAKSHAVLAWLTRL